MTFIKHLKKLRDNYIINQVENAKLPKFKGSPFIRRRLIFSGRVQKVGFRFELYLMAKRLGLSGWVKNRDDKSVEAEIQGQEEKIDFLTEFMKSLIRISVRKVEVTEIPIVKDEDSFILVK